MTTSTTYILYAAIAAVMLVLYLYSKARNKKSNTIADGIIESSLASNVDTAGKTKIYRPGPNNNANSQAQTDAQLGDRLGSITSKKIIRVVYIALLVGVLYAIGPATGAQFPLGQVLTFKNPETNLLLFACLVFTMVSVYQLFLLTKVVYLHEKGIIYRSLFASKKIEYKYLVIIKGHDTVRRKPIAGSLFEMNYFNYDVKKLVYYFNGNNGTSIRLPKSQFNRLEKKVTELQANLVWM